MDYKHYLSVIKTPVIVYVIFYLAISYLFPIPRFDAIFTAGGLPLLLARFVVCSRCGTLLKKANYSTLQASLSGALIYFVDYIVLRVTGHFLMKLFYPEDFNYNIVGFILGSLIIYVGTVWVMVIASYLGAKFGKLK